MKTLPILWRRMGMLVPVLVLSAFIQDPFPGTVIKNEFITAGFYLPDGQSGYYRGTRFDWSGVMPFLSYKNHQYFGQWNEKYDPVLHDAIMGPVEEFAVLGYEEADTGKTFVKIGIGALLKPAEKSFQRFGNYQIADPGKWIIRKKKDAIRFVHELNHPDYGYQYEKTVRLVPGKPVMEIVHTLKNKGAKTMETNVYDHNFFVMDSTYTGSGHQVIFPFALKVDPARVKDFVNLKGNTISFKRDMVKGETVNLGKITGFTNSIEDFDIRIENRKTGSGVRIRGDKPISELIFWAAYKVLSPEPYINIHIEPGKEFSWKLTYAFYTL